MKKYMEYHDEKSNKFWEITLNGASFTVRFGKTGTAGQVQTKEFGAADEAKLEAEKLLKEKLKKGYVPVGDVLEERAIPNQTNEKPSFLANLKAVKPTFSGEFQDQPLIEFADEYPISRLWFNENGNTIYALKAYRNLSVKELLTWNPPDSIISEKVKIEADQTVWLNENHIMDSDGETAYILNVTNKLKQKNLNIEITQNKGFYCIPDFYQIDERWILMTYYNHISWYDLKADQITTSADQEQNIERVAVDSGGTDGFVVLEERKGLPFKNTFSIWQGEQMIKKFVAYPGETPVSEHQPGVDALVYHAAKQFLIFGMPEGIEIFDTVKGVIIGFIPLKSDMAMKYVPQCRLALTSDGRWLFASIGTRLQLIDLETRAIVNSWKGHRNAITAMAISPDGKRVVTGDREGIIGLWKLQ